MSAPPSGQSMLTPAQARDQARRRLGRSQRGWTLGGWSAPVWTLALRVPTERQVLADPAAAEHWVRAWRAEALPEGLSVDWEDRVWRSVGTQRVPVRLVVESPQALAAYVGGREAREVAVFAGRVERVRGLAGVVGSAVEAVDGAGTDREPDPVPALDAVLRRHAERLTALDEDEFARVLEVSAWLLEHPVSGLRPRQLPIRGVDSKWFSRHRTLLSALHGALGGASGGLGIVDADPRVRLRILDPALRPAGLTDLQVPAVELAGLGWAPERVLIVENLETLLCLPDAEGTVAVWGSGFDVTSVSLPWLTGVPILYWGDLDSQGFAVLHRYRSHLPQIRTVLMDDPTLEAFRDLWVPEPTPFKGAPDTLTPAELRTLQRLRAEGDVRLEQERIGWDYALERLRQHLPLDPSGTAGILR